MQPLDPSELKALFAQLVDAIGTQEAAATFLGVSRQRVGQLISTSWEGDLPTIMQIAKLEAVCGQAIVTGALARRVEGGRSGDAMTASVQCVAAAADSIRTLHNAVADGVLDEDEHVASVKAARKTLEAAQRDYDARVAMRPTLKAVA